MRAFRTLLWVVALGATVSTAVLAPTDIAAAQTAQQRSRARQLYGEAQALFDSGQYAAAESSFRAAYEAVPNPVVLKAIAASQERQGNISGSIETLRQYLSAAPDAADHDEVQQHLEELLSHPATLAVSSTPSGASIIVDGEDSGQVTPADVEMPPGNHSVQLRMTGYQPAEHDVSAEAGSRVRLELTLTEAQPEQAGSDEDVFGSEGGDGAAATPGGGGGGGGGGGIPDGVWATAAITAVGLISGTVFGFLALSAESDYNNHATKKTADQGEMFALIADISFGVAALGAITSLIWYFVAASSGGDDSQSARPNLTVTPWVSLGGGGLGAQLRF